MKKHEHDFIINADGTIFDTRTAFHSRAESIVLQEICNICVEPEKIAEQFYHLTDKKIFEELAPDYNPLLLLKDKWKTMFSLIGTHPVDYREGMYELVYLLQKRVLNTAIATTSPIHWIEKCFERAQSPQNFQKKTKLSKSYSGKIFSSHNCQKDKASPDILLKAYNSFYLAGHSKNDCFVIGDSRSDVLSGLSAGFRVLYLSNNKEFDSSKYVKRFETSLELSDHVIKELM